MGTKLSNPHLLRLLLPAAHAADRLSSLLPINEGARLACRHLLVPAVEACLRRACPSASFRLVSRHSVAERGEFNPFLSDLDFTLITEHDPAPLLEAYSAMGRHLWCLGELEVYPACEWQALEQLRAQEGPTLELIWQLRKLRWQQDTLAQARSEYHRAKARRAIRRIFRKLGIAALEESWTAGPAQIAQAILRRGPWLPPGVQAAPISGNSNFLGWPLEGVPAGFVAILPHGEEVAAGIRAPIEHLREFPEVGRRLAAVFAFELLLCRSKRRLVPSEPSAWWEAYLLERIRKHAPAGTSWTGLI